MPRQKSFTERARKADKPIAQPDRDSATPPAPLLTPLTGIYAIDEVPPPQPGEYRAGPPTPRGRG